MTMSMVAEQVFALARTTKIPLVDEKKAQAVFADAMTGAGIDFEREVRLSSSDIVDFMVGDIAVEMKVKGSRASIYRQLERYAEHDCVKEIVLLTARSMGLPQCINCKPALSVSLSRAWL